MINGLSNSLWTKVFCCLMSLYLLNISVDSVDFYTYNNKEDLSINDQESIIEIVLEKILGYEDAIAEYDDNETEETNLQKRIQLDDFLVTELYCSLAYCPLSIFPLSNPYFLLYKAPLAQGALRIFSPPPEVQI